MWEGNSSIWGAMMTHQANNRPTRLVRASVVDIRTSISSAGIPRTLVDCIGVLTRETINDAVVLGSSGMLWQTDRMPLKPTTRNIVTGTQYSDNSVDRMAEMAHDLDSTGWDGDEVCIGFLGRDAVILGTFQHRMAWIDLEEDPKWNLEPGRRLQDQDAADEKDYLLVAIDDSHPDALVSRWGRYIQTFWETRGGIGEIRRPNNEPGEEGYFYSSVSAQWEFSLEWARVESHHVRLASLVKDDYQDQDFILDERNILMLSDGSETSYFKPKKEDLVDGIIGIVDFDVLGFSVTKQAGGSSSNDELASATRYPELKSFIDRMQDQIDELRTEMESVRDYLVKVVTGIAVMSIPATVPINIGGTAIAAADLTEALATISKDLTPVKPAPDQQKLSDARSDVFRVGR